jgi:hypothetical protein
MTTRHGGCACGQLKVTVEGDPVRISVCHCLDCQRRTGSVFGTQARYPRKQVRIEGAHTAFTRRADSGNTVTSHFCLVCGSTVYWELTVAPEVLAVAVGAFADPGFPPPRFSVYERRRHGWALPSVAVEHLD